MQRNLNHDDFDRFLQESADGLRMRPSGKVWKGIARELDRRKRRFAFLFALSLIFISGTYITWEVTTTNTHQQIARQHLPDYSLPVQRHNTQPSPKTLLPANKYKTSTAFSGTGTMPVTATKNGQKKGPATVVKKQIAPVEMPAVAAAAVIPKTPIDTFSAIAAIPFDATPAALLAAEKATLRPDLNIKEIPEAQSSGFATAPKTRNRSKWSWQVFAAPTVSYRKLSDNKNYVRPILTTGIPANFSALYGINEAVIHKPDLGIEFGVMARYPIAKNLLLRTGFQFNVSRYAIKAFSYVPEVATIALNNGFGVDSVRAISNYRNFAGSGGSNWLQNFYFQASVPVGLELKIAGNKKAHWAIASSLQPTYLIGNRSYMITADYKNYARVPWLSRRWNMNTSLETFVSINSEKAQWQIGPQVRYQALSSFINEYPVRENLFDFGMKVGITLK